MPDNIGFSFAPGADQQTRDQAMPGGGMASRGTSPQQAVKILSLRVPKQLPSSAPVSRALLNGPGGAGAPGLTSMIQQLMQAFQPHPVTDQFPQSPAPRPMDAQPDMSAGQGPTKENPPPSSPGAPPPSYEGDVDTDPTQNAPPLDFSNGGGGPQLNGWEYLTLDDQQRQAYLDSIGRQLSMRQPTPSPKFVVQNPPVGGGGVKA